MGRMNTQNSETESSFLWHVPRFTWIGTGSKKMDNNTSNNEITFETDLFTDIWQTIENLDNYWQFRIIPHNFALSCGGSKISQRRGLQPQKGC